MHPFKNSVSDFKVLSSHGNIKIFVLCSVFFCSTILHKNSFSSEKKSVVESEPYFCREAVKVSCEFGSCSYQKKATAIAVGKLSLIEQNMW